MLNAGCRSILASAVLGALAALGAAGGCSLDREPALDRGRNDGGGLDGGGGDGGSGGPPRSCDDDNGGCSPLVDCLPTADGAAACGPCPSGTTDVNLDGTLCTDIDECELGLDECDINPRAMCINVMSSYRCRCPEGTADPTGSGRNCIPGAGPVDECELGTDDCDDDPEALCIDDEAGFTCQCPAGYEDPATNGTACTDIDECELGLDDCDDDPAADCENTPGGFTCTCPDGYEDERGDGTVCSNIDDCALGEDECDDDPEACVDGVGGYACVCPGGYDDVNGDGTVCEDIDECDDAVDACDDAPVAQCDNTVGSYTCTCPATATDPLGDGTVCTAPETRVALGARHACAIIEGGEITCWGHNNKGQLGQGVTSGPSEAIGDRTGETGDKLPKVNIGDKAVALAAGCNHTCALTPNGKVKCWGNNDYGQLGLNDRTARGVAADQMGDNLPSVPLAMDATAITAGCNFSCALLASGGVVCWGDNDFGQLGQGSTTDLGDDEGEVQALSPIPLNGTVKAVKAGFRFVCAQLSTNLLQCWGRNTDGQLGINETAHRGDNPNEMGSTLPLVSLGPGVTVVDFAAGYTHACALLSNDTVKCWGGEADGGTGYGDPLINRGDGVTQMGETTMGSEMGANLPVLDLTGAGSPASLAAQRHTCIRFEDGSVGCFGRNSTGELGIGSTDDRGDQAGEMGAMLQKAPLGTGALAMAVITGHEEGTNDANSCALLGNGELKCWGANVRGQLGLGDAQARGDMPDEMGDELPAILDLWD